MPKIQHTDEFSIILHLDERAGTDVIKLRKLMTVSPYRDDKPHVTLLRGVRTPVPMDDKTLHDDLKPYIDRLLKPKPHALVVRVDDLAGGYYKDTSAVVVSASAGLQREHAKLLQYLRETGFKFNPGSTIRFTPHATIRLGVPLDDKTLERAREVFPGGREIRFAGWALNRLISHEGPRRFYEVPG